MHRSLAGASLALMLSLPAPAQARSVSGPSGLLTANYAIGFVDAVALTFSGLGLLTARDRTAWEKPTLVVAGFVCAFAGLILAVDAGGQPPAEVGPFATDVLLIQGGAVAVAIGLAAWALVGGD